MNAPLSEQQRAEIRDARYQVGSLAAADEHVTALLAEVDQLRKYSAEQGQGLNDLAELVRSWHQKATSAEARIADLEREAAAAKVERDIEIIAWLVKKASEYRSVVGAEERVEESVADVLCRMATKISAGAVPATAQVGA